MKKYSLYYYRMLIILIIIIILSLSYENYNLIKSINKDSSANNNYLEVANNKLENYSFTDMLEILKRDKNINIVDISKTLDNEKIINIKIEYMGALDSLYNTLESFKKSENFCLIDNIKLETNSKNEKIISSNIYFIKNK